MKANEIRNIEVDLFLEALRRRHDYDFSHYAKASLKRRLAGLLTASGHKSIAELIPLVLRNEAFLPEVISHLSVQVSEMFRDPHVFLALREKIIPVLKTYSRVKIWVAGCATGEEAYSIAIMLKEEGLSSRSQIYATDIDASALIKAEEGIYALKNVAEYTRNYQKSGGKKSFSDYYHAKYDYAILDASLKENILFSQHNLVVDGTFSEAHLIVCRNVLIYFDKDLQDQVIQLLTDSLVRGGYLCIGTAESLKFSNAADIYEVIAEKEKIFRHNKVREDMP